nr:GPP34 family phosphoprotein [Micromonospora sp. DSM 115978]
MLIAEELLLMALDPVKGSPVNSNKQPMAATLAGALVAELAIEGGVVVDDKRFRSVGKRPTHPLLAQAHRQLETIKGRRSADQLRRLDKALGGVWKQVAGGLASQGVVRREERRVLFVGVDRHPVRRTDLRGEVIGRAQAAAVGDGPLDPRTATLLALAGPSRLLEVVAPDRADRKHARDRIATATKESPVAPVVL